VSNSPLAIITGASSGIGRVLALKLAERGYHTVVMARRAERLAELKAELEERFPALRCHAIAVDLTDVPAAQRAFEEAVELAQSEAWTLTVLANNAGSGEWRPFTRIPIEKQLQVIELNIKACTRYTRLFLDQTLGQEHRAYVLNVASIASFLPVPNYAVYSGSKGYLRYLNEALNFELRGSKVSLTCLCPGGTATEFLQVAGNETTALSKFGMMPADAVAECGLRAMFKRKQVVVPGASNRFVRVLLAVLPQALGQRLINAILGLGMKKDWV
jgi:uncharacterized protein